MASKRSRKNGAKSNQDLNDARISSDAQIGLDGIPISSSNSNNQVTTPHAVPSGPDQQPQRRKKGKRQWKSIPIYEYGEVPEPDNAELGTKYVGEPQPMNNYTELPPSPTQSPSAEPIQNSAGYYPIFDNRYYPVPMGCYVPIPGESFPNGVPTYSVANPNSYFVLILRPVYFIPIQPPLPPINQGGYFPPQ